MSTLFILIIVIGGYHSQSGFTTVQAEFISWSACETARKHIVDSIRSKQHNTAGVIQSQGCHAKG